MAFWRWSGVGGTSSEQGQHYHHWLLVKVVCIAPLSGAPWEGDMTPLCFCSTQFFKDEQITWKEVFAFYRFTEIIFKNILITYNSCTGGFLGHVHICVHWTLDWLISPFFSLPPTPFLKWLQQVSVFHTHTCVARTSSMFTLLTFFIHSSPPTTALPFM
jgi:hypothetical protein